MAPYFPYAGSPALHAVWLALDMRLDGTPLEDLLQAVELAGDFDDGDPGWVWWDRLPEAEALLNEAGLLSPRRPAAIRVCVALSGLEQDLRALDPDSLAIVSRSLQALVNRLPLA